MSNNRLNENSQGQNFFTGLLLGAVISGGAFYLTMTKSGRKIARELLKKAEEIGEEGYDLIEELTESKKGSQLKEKASKKIDGIIDKLKGEVRSVKKS